jgi:FF domain
MKETESIDKNSRWSDIKKKIDDDKRYGLLLCKSSHDFKYVCCRYRAVDSSSTREDWFYDYVKSLKEEKKEKSHKDKDSDRHSKGETKDDDKKESDQNVSSLTNNTKEGEEETDEKNSYDEDNEKVSARVKFQVG